MINPLWAANEMEQRDQLIIGLRRENTALLMLNDELEQAIIRCTATCEDLAAENATLRAESAEIKKLGGAEQDEDIESFTKRVTEQRKEYDALCADAARYRWLRDYKRTCEAGGPIVMQGQCLEYPITGDRLDAAIDAAIENEASQTS